MAGAPRIVSFWNAGPAVLRLAGDGRVARLVREDQAARQHVLAPDDMSRQQFDTLLSWKAARALAVAIHRATGSQPFQANPELRGELRAAAMAVMTAIAEGYDQKSCAEFERRLATACGAVARLESLICLAGEMGCLPRDIALRLRARATYAAGLIEALRQAVTRYQRLNAMPAPARVN